MFRIVKMMTKSFGSAGRRFTDALYPRRCPVCGEIVSPKGRLICPDCAKRLNWILGPTCRRCGKEVATEQAEYCPDCARRRRNFDLGFALCNYGDTEKGSIARIKYQGRREYLDFYGAAMAERLGPRLLRLAPDALVPVPVHPSRRRKRGFNQAEVLAERFSEAIKQRYGRKIPVRTDLLFRGKKTMPQKDLSPAERKRNLEQAFIAGRIPPDIRSVVLIDDIYTTGSTAEACAKALKAAGIERVYAAVIAISH